MIKSLPCIGIQYGKTKSGNFFSKVWIDVTDCFSENDRIGVYSSTAFYNGTLPRDIVGKDILCSVDRFGKIIDIDIIK